MFTREEIKEFVIKLGKKWFFPNFYNKVTWYVITLGAGVILTPVPFKLVVYNWIIDTFNLNSGELLKLSEMGSNSSDYYLGFALILLALLHNVFSKWLLHQDEVQHNIQLRHESDKISAVDTELFKEFLAVFPSGSRSAYMLETHDFGNSFRLESLKDIDTFVDGWNCPEKSFINPDLEVKRKELWNKCHEFSWLLAKKSAPTRGGLHSVVPDQHRNDWDWPDWVDEDVRAVNETASEVFKLHQEFIKSMRVALKC